MKQIEQHMAQHYRVIAAEEKKSDDFGSRQHFGNEINGVLSQLTNSILPTTHIEGKGENFATDGMSTYSKPMGIP